ncbi:NADP-dependent oxidoreductase [Phanerochaete sordida]|uniref:NADP-dependent oxidoreductase n=1 Tax=Phanerochaete sordida TaxID=48140 RepID=A0A9P3GKC2_9APHY|nr:NADP-dependent oxidoreductase [Phanerochaete sordida]
MSPTTYTRIVLRERPTGAATPFHFRVERAPLDLHPQAGEVLVKTLYLSLDPHARRWLNPEPGHFAPIQVGDVVRSFGLGVVVEAGAGSSLKVGDLVDGLVGWTEYGVHDAKALQKVDIPQGCDPVDLLGPLGTTGLTAYFGLFDVAHLKAGETLVVSGAAGATGNVVCQLAKRAGARVVAIAGGPEKCAWLERELGVDKAIDYKSASFRADFAAVAPKLDVYFDNVGGEILDLALTQLNRGARVILCGATSEYNSKPKGITNYFQLVMARATMKGFLIFDYESRYAEGRADLVKVIHEGKLKSQFHVVEGIENTPEAFQLLFSGGNTGKLVVKVIDL